MWDILFVIKIITQIALTREIGRHQEEQSMLM
jgi:hypothetical protein